MLAGVLLELCLAPVRALPGAPWLVGTVVAVWLVVLRLAPRWAAPAALTAAAALALTSPTSARSASRTPHPTLAWTTPTFSLEALVTLAIPLFVVTMGSQNCPGVAVLAGLGYRAPLRRALLTTGAGTVAAAPFGAHAIDLAAISAALAAGPEAGPDRDRRWVAAATAGGAVVLGLLSGGVAALALAAPAGLVEAAAGLALVTTFGAALRSAFEDGATAVPAAATSLVTVSGLRLAGVGPAFWGWWPAS